MMQAKENLLPFLLLLLVSICLLPAYSLADYPSQNLSEKNVTSSPTQVPLADQLLNDMKKPMTTYQIHDQIKKNTALDNSHVAERLLSNMGHRSNDETQAENWALNGSRFLQSGRYEEAVAAFDTSLGLNPNESAVWKEKGDALLQLKRYDEAVEALNRSLALKPDNPSVWSSTGSALMQLNRYEEAARAFNKSIEYDQNNDHLWALQGAALYMLKDYEAALRSLERSLEINPRDATEWCAKGDILDQLGRYDEAVQAYDKALGIDPGYTDAKEKREKDLNR